MTNPKLQAPNPNALPTAKSQNAMARRNPKSGLRRCEWVDIRLKLEFGNSLGFGIWECVGIWSLELGI